MEAMDGVGTVNGWKGTLEDAAKSRRERLAAMREAAGSAPEPKRARMAPPSETAPEPEAPAAEGEVRLRFRNYQPADEGIKAESEAVTVEAVSVEAVVAEKLQEQEEAGEANIHQLDSTDLLNLVPQKVDWYELFWLQQNHALVPT